MATWTTCLGRLKTSTPYGHHGMQGYGPTIGGADKAEQTGTGSFTVVNPEVFCSSNSWYFGIKHHGAYFLKVRFLPKDTLMGDFSQLLFKQTVPKLQCFEGRNERVGAGILVLGTI